MIVLFTDFGWRGPYVGQLEAAILTENPHARVVDLFNDLPPWNVRAAAYLLPAYASDFPTGSVFVCVVDPGVGTARLPVVVRVDGRWFTGPDNGLFDPLIRGAREATAWRIAYRPPRLSRSFHGRDLFAPVAAMLERGQPPALEAMDTASLLQEGWGEELAEVIYIDGYGNAITGLRAGGVTRSARVACGGREMVFRPVFGEARRGQLFWYENANGLLEIAANQDSAARRLGLRVGDSVAWVEYTRCS